MMSLTENAIHHRLRRLGYYLKKPRLGIGRETIMGLATRYLATIILF